MEKTDASKRMLKRNIMEKNDASKRMLKLK